MMLTKVFKGSDQLLKIRGCGNECMMYCAFFFLHIFFVLLSLYIVSKYKYISFFFLLFLTKFLAVQFVLFLSDS